MGSCIEDWIHILKNTTTKHKQHKCTNNNAYIRKKVFTLNVFGPNRSDLCLSPPLFDLSGTFDISEFDIPSVACTQERNPSNHLQTKIRMSNNTNICAEVLQINFKNDINKLRLCLSDGRGSLQWATIYRKHHYCRNIQL